MGKTVTTYLVDGNPQGTRYAFICNKNCQMFVVPRSDLGYLSRQPKLQKSAFYVLTGEADISKPQAYIGETENFMERVKSHDNKKAFWQRALVFVAKDADMTKADVKYLEYRAIAEARKANTFVLDENKQTPKEPNLPEYQRDTMDEFFEDVKFLAAFMGCTIFEVANPKEEYLFYTNGRGSSAKGCYNSTGFIVLKGSVIAASVTPSFSWKEERDRMVKEYTTLVNGALVMSSDKTFTSPSRASEFCLGRVANGWVEWKNASGNTLNTVYRQQVDG